MRDRLHGHAEVRYARLAGAVLALALSLCAHASAHDPPFGTGIFVRDGGLLVRTNRGLVLARGPERRPLLLCNEALGINTAEVPAIVAVAEDGWLVGSSQGLSNASPDLCRLEPVPALGDVAVPAVVRDPHSAARIFASTGQANFGNAVFASDDDGRSFDVHSDRDTDRMFDHVLVSPSDPLRVYASGLRLMPTANGFTAFFAVSEDGAKTFSEHPFILEQDEYGIELLGVHPTDPQIVFGVAHANLGTGIKDRLLVSRDASKSFATTATFDKLEAFVIDSTGASVHVGARDGLWVSSDAGDSFEQLQNVPVHCLARDGDQLYLCDDRDGRTGVSVSSDGGRSLSSVFRFMEVTSRVQCAPGSAAESVCAVPWQDWQRELNAGFGDAGVRDAAAPDAMSNHDAAADGGSTLEPRKGTDGGGCSAASHPGKAEGPGWWLVLCALAWMRGRPRTTRRATIGCEERTP